jgi:diamine N-acetyltransferase
LRAAVSIAAGLELVAPDADDVPALAALARLAAAAYLPHYADLWEDGGAGYAARAFAPALFAAAARDSAVRLRTLVFEARPVGFAQWRLPTSQPRLAAGSGPFADAVYLERLYLLPTATGRGLGAEVLRAVEADARDAGVAAIGLRAMACRPALVDYYRRQGYVPVGIDQLDAPGVVAGRSEMVRLQKGLPAAAGEA